MIRTAIAVVGLCIYGILLGPPFIVYTAISGNTAPLFRWGLAGQVFFLRLVGVRLRVEGAGNIPAGPCLFAANHASYVDPPLVTRAIPRQIGILMKKSIFSIPIVGTTFRQAHFVPIDRDKASEAMASLDLAAGYIRQGTSYLIYPEGTRSPDGRLRAFKSGAFLLAIKTGVPVVPVACAGAHRILPKKSLRMRPGEVVVRFCPPVETTGYTPARRAELAQQVWNAIAASLPPDQQPVAPTASPVSAQREP